MLWLHLFGIEFFQRSCQAYKAVASGIYSFLKHYLPIASVLSILRHFSKVICSAYESMSAGFFLNLWSRTFGPSEFLYVPRSMLSYMSTAKLTKGDYFKRHTPRLYCQYLDSSSPRGLGICNEKCTLHGTLTQVLPISQSEKHSFAYLPWALLPFLYYFFSTPFYEYTELDTE